MKKEMVEIPEYTYDQYIGTSEPYEFLYSFKDNKFLVKQIKQTM